MVAEDGCRFLLAQLNFRVGDIVGNKQKIISVCDFAQNSQVNCVIFPEMSLPGYPIKDLIFDRDFFESEQASLQKIAEKFPKMIIIIGGFGKEKNPSHHPRYQNNAYILSNGHIQATISKRLTPTYDVFDEKRYFWSGTDYTPIDLLEIQTGIAICEDLWDHDYQVDVAANLVKNGAHLIISINGSPYYIGKQKAREQLVAKKAVKFKIPIIYLNAIGGQDELVFDGRSFITNSLGEIVLRAPFCRESVMVVDYNMRQQLFSYVSPSYLPKLEIPTIIPKISSNILHSDMVLIPENSIDNLYTEEQEICEALVMNLRDYYYKTGVFSQIVLGLSGGIDSAFTAYIAAQAVGSDKVIAVLMPSKYSSKGSIEDSIVLCKNLNICYYIFPIKEAHKQLSKQFDTIFNAPSTDNDTELANQNLQSRLRGLILMYYTNKFRALLVSTGNKSEIATGYCTLYGDTNGGKNVPGDLYKTQLYKVVGWINREHEIIPSAIITKPPSAELKENQKDEDNLPPYPILDEILKLRIDEGYSPREIIRMGKDPELVTRVEHLYTHSEFKRAQIAQTIKVNKKTFGSGRKIPVLKKTTY
ncbi:MAG: NAD+ synthase [Promethearchaeota archaeon]